MKKKIIYTDEPLGVIEVVTDFLSATAELAFREDGVKVTLALSKREARKHDEFLRRKVDVARSSMRAGLGRSNDEVEAEFAARRTSKPCVRVIWAAREDFRHP